MEYQILLEETFIEGKKQAKKEATYRWHTVRKMR